MPKLNLVRDIIGGDEVQDAIRDGIDAIYEVALASYGANSGNVLIEHRYGEPLVSHDGITNVNNLVLGDSVENSAVSIVRQASEKTNRNAGDSTTLTIVLAKLAYDYWSNQGLTPRQAQRAMQEYANGIVAAIKEKRIECTPELLQQVSRVSSGDEAIGAMVADAVGKINNNGSITVVETPDNIISSEVIDGFTFKKGIRVPALADDLQTLKTRYENPAIIVLPKLIAKNDDILPILDKAIRADKTPIVLIADVSGQALETIVANKLKGVLNIAVVEPPVNDRDAFMSDIAKYASTKQYTGRPDDFDVEEYIGTADSVSITLSETTINGCQSPDELQTYLADIESTERRERLLGKTVRIAVGAPTQSERQELKLRIEDAVCAAQTAFEYGVLPGGGVFLRDYDRSGYLAEPFKILTSSDGEYDDGVGYNIETGEKVNVVEAGIVDSAKAIEEAVTNAHSAAAQLLSIRLALPFTEDME